LLSVALASLIHSTQPVAAKTCGKYDIHFIPLETQFYVPVTEKDIERRAQSHFTVTSCDLDKMTQLPYVKKTVVGGLRVKIENRESRSIIFITSKMEVIINKMTISNPPSELLNRIIQELVLHHRQSRAKN